MKKSIKKTIDVITIEIYCDICGNDAERYCSCCNKDICLYHAVYDNSPNEDYHDYYCDTCWSIGMDFRVKIRELEDELENKKRELKAEWFKRAKDIRSYNETTTSKDNPKI